MSVVKHFPNFLTVCNLVCGCLGLFMVFQGQLIIAAYLIWIATLFDFADGLAARALHVHSELGKQLDSLADMVSFGVLPAFIMLGLLQNFAPTPNHFLVFSAFLIAVFSAIRLGKFNIDTRQTHSFIGVPTPSNAILISSFPIIVSQSENWLAPTLSHFYVLVGLCVILSLLLVSPFELMALKFKNLNWKGNEVRFIFAILVIVLFIVLHITAIPIIFILYFFASYFNRQAKKDETVAG